MFTSAQSIAVAAVLALVPTFGAGASAPEAAESDALRRVLATESHFRAQWSAAARQMEIAATRGDDRRIELLKAYLDQLTLGEQSALKALERDLGGDRLRALRATASTILAKERAARRARAGPPAGAGERTARAGNGRGTRGARNDRGARSDASSSGPRQISLPRVGAGLSAAQLRQPNSGHRARISSTPPRAAPAHRVATVRPTASTSSARSRPVSTRSTSGGSTGRAATASRPPSRPSSGTASASRAPARTTGDTRSGTSGTTPSRRSAESQAPPRSRASRSP